MGDGGGYVRVCVRARCVCPGTRVPVCMYVRVYCMYG